MRLLAIETSCDETAIAIADFLGPKQHPSVKVLSHIISSQVALHKKFGGVVPNLAKREHQKNLAPLLIQALREAGLQEARSKKQELRIKKKSRDSKFVLLDSILQREPELLRQFKKNIVPLAPPPVDAIAVTYGPGLAPALWVGVNFAKALVALWKKPLIQVNHMAGHLYSAFLQKSGVNSKFPPMARPATGGKIQNSKFPALALLVSGGHTELVLVRGHGKFKVIGETRDDAAGEAFDKVARLLGLGYPGGPAVSALAETKFKVKSLKLKIRLPRPMRHSKDFDFSFSGLKTAVLYLARDLGPQKTKKLRPVIAKEFQKAIVEILVAKTIRAAKEYRIKTILLGGGVAANKLLRQKLSEAVGRELPHVACRMSHVALTGDNALMIALAAYFLAPTPKTLRKKEGGWKKVQADANARLEYP